MGAGAGGGKGKEPCLLPGQPGLLLVPRLEGPRCSAGCARQPEPAHRNRFRGIVSTRGPRAPGPAALRAPVVAVPSGLLKPALEGVDGVIRTNTWSRGRSGVIDVIIFMNDRQ